MPLFYAMGDLQRSVETGLRDFQNSPLVHALLHTLLRSIKTLAEKGLGTRANVTTYLIWPLFGSTTNLVVAPLFTIVTS
jgi:hypothetical protein